MQVAMNGFMGSDLHKDSILATNSNIIGIGVVEHDGIYHWVQLFGEDELKQADLTKKNETVQTTIEIPLRKVELYYDIQEKIYKDEITGDEEATAYIHNTESGAYDEDLLKVDISDLEYDVSDSSVINIDEKGNVKYNKIGKCEITVKLKNYPSIETTKVINVMGKLIDAEVQDIPDQKYTGSEIKPKVVVKYDGNILTENKDYSLRYKNNTNCGVATVYIAGKGDYDPEYATKANFNIVKDNTNLVVRPQKVENVKINQIDYTNVTLSWGKVSDATGYKVYKYDEETKKYKYYGATTNLTLNISKLTPNTEYNFKVSAYKELGENKYEGTASDAITVTTGNPTPTDIRIVKAENITTNSLKLTWEKLPNISGYQILKFDYTTRRYNKLKTIADSSTTSYVVTGLNPSTKYNFIVIAYRNVEGINYLGKQSSANPAVQVTKVAPITATRDETTTNAIRLTWSASPNATGYIIYRYNYSKKKYEKIVTTRDVTYVFTKLPSATKYNFKVKAYKVDNNKTYYGAASKTIITTTKPGKATNARATGKTKTRIRIRWNRVRGATGYRVYIYDSKTKKYKYYGSTKNTTALIKNRKANTTYKIKVQAYKKPYKLVYLGAASNTIRVKTLK